MQEILLVVLLIQIFLNFILTLRTYYTYNDTFLRLIDYNEKIVLKFLDHYNDDNDDNDEDDEDDEDDYESLKETTNY